MTTTATDIPRLAYPDCESCGPQRRATFVVDCGGEEFRVCDSCVPPGASRDAVTPLPATVSTSTTGAATRAPQR
jgi:ribosome-binding protein aMBF1 (putative translation factor)